MEQNMPLSDHLIEELGILLDAESQLIEALPKMMDTSQSSVLKALLGDHWEITKGQAKRLQYILSNIRQNPQTPSKAMKRFIEEFQVLINKAEDAQGIDVVIIEVLQRIKQYEIFEYKAACQHSSELGHTMIMELLDKSLNEERVFNAHLIDLAQNIENLEMVGSRGFYIPLKKFNRKGPKKRSKNMDVSRYIDEGNPNLGEF
jgi:ferritin-like metal-binding protein YciE